LADKTAETKILHVVDLHRVNASK